MAERASGGRVPRRSVNFHAPRANPSPLAGVTRATKPFPTPHRPHPARAQLGQIRARQERARDVEPLGLSQCHARTPRFAVLCRNWRRPSRNAVRSPITRWTGPAFSRTTLRKGYRVRPSRYFLFAFGACPPCGLIVIVCFAVLADKFVGASFVLWAFAILVGVPAGLAYLVGNRSKLTGQQVAAGSIVAASLACVEAFVLLLIALSQATLRHPDAVRPLDRCAPARAATRWEPKTGGGGETRTSERGKEPGSRRSNRSRQKPRRTANNFSRPIMNERDGGYKRHVPPSRRRARRPLDLLPRTLRIAVRVRSLVPGGQRTGLACGA